MRTNKTIEDESSEIREELKEYNITMHHKTGIDKLRTTLEEAKNGTYTPSSLPSVEANEGKLGAFECTEPTEAAKTAAARHNDPKDPSKLTKEQRALKLVRIIVSPNDSNMAEYPGMIFTVGSSAVNKGRMIKKYVPFNNEEGWHVPNIIYDMINNAEMQKFRPKEMANGQKVMEPYMTKKYTVTMLPPLTKDEMSALAASQQAKGGFN